VQIGGWALDDVFVKDVEVCLHRAPRPPSDARAPIRKDVAGSCDLVDGSRPDVRAAFPTAPFNDRAAWSFDVSPDALPGDGHVDISAVARDSAGHWAVLNRTLTLDVTQRRPH
jgi:hypothetical protein